MANRFWVGNGGNINDTAHWSTTSGGAGGASVPTSADNAYFDSSSFTLGGQTVTTNATFNCLDLDWTGAANSPTFAGVSGVNIYGSLTFISAMTVTSMVVFFQATTTGKTITMAGKSITPTFSGVGGGWTLQDAFSSGSNSISLTSGTLNTNGQAVTCGTFSASGTLTRTLTLGASIITCSGTGSAWTTAVTTNLTFNANTSTIILTGSSPTFDGGGLTYYNVTFSGTSTGTTVVGSNTFNTFTVSVGCTVKLTASTTQTVTNLISNGNTTSRATIKSLTAASAATISTASAINQSFLIVQDITKSGAGSITFNLSQDVSGNTGITFNNTLYWIGGTGNTSDTSHWSLTSGGASASATPTSYISARFDANSFSGAGQTVTVNATFDCLDMTWTGATNNPTFSAASQTNCNGSVTFIAAMTTTGTMQFNLVATSTGKTITTNGLNLTFTLAFNGSGGGWTLQDDVTFIGNRSIVISAGTFNSNNKNISAFSFSSTGASTRSITLGSSVLTLFGSFTLVASGLTFNSGTSTIILTGSSLTFAGANFTFNNVTFAGTPFTITGSNTFNILTISVGKTLNLTSGTTQTITSLICNGTTASPSTLQSVTAGSAATIALPAGRYFIRHTSIKDITVSGATAVTSIAGTNVSGNTGITFVTKFEMGRIKNDGSFNWYSTSTGLVTKVSG